MATDTDTTRQDIHDIIFDMGNDVCSVKELIHAAQIVASHRSYRYGLDPADCKALGRLLTDALQHAERLALQWEVALNANPRHHDDAAPGPASD